MRRTYGGRIAVFVAVLISGLIGVQTSRGQSQSSSTGLPSEMPARIEPVTSSFDYVRREAMIPMRDGVKLHTVILVPKGAKNAGILLTRTPYDADTQTNHASAYLGPTLRDRKSTRLNSSHANISYAVFCLKKKKTEQRACQCTTPRQTRHSRLH